MENKKLVTISLMLPKSMRESIDEAVSNNTHVNLSEFVRDAIRRRLEETILLELTKK